MINNAILGLPININRSLLPQIAILALDLHDRNLERLPVEFVPAKEISLTMLPKFMLALGFPAFIVLRKRYITMEAQVPDLLAPEPEALLSVTAGAIQ
jgi:hypothetical protein